MKIKKFVFPLLLLFCLAGYGQTKDEIINNIRTDFQSINRDTTLKKILVEDEDFMEQATDGGGELTGYFKNKSLVKIVEWIGLSFGNRTREFYLKENKLFFVYEKFQFFLETDSGLNHEKFGSWCEARYYFNNEKLISKKITGKYKIADAPSAAELLTQKKDYLKLLNKKK